MRSPSSRKTDAFPYANERVCIFSSPYRPRPPCAQAPPTPRAGPTPAPPSGPGGRGLVLLREQEPHEVRVAHRPARPRPVTPGAVSDGGEGHAHPSPAHRPWPRPTHRITAPEKILSIILEEMAAWGGRGWRLGAQAPPTGARPRTQEPRPRPQEPRPRPTCKLCPLCQATPHPVCPAPRPRPRPSHAPPSPPSPCRPRSRVSIKRSWSRSTQTPPPPHPGPRPLQAPPCPFPGPAPLPLSQPSLPSP